MVDFSGLLQDLLSKFTSGLPNLFTAIVILIIGLIVAKIVSGIIRKLLVSIKIDKLGDQLNEIELVSKADIDIKISHVVAKVFYYIIALFAIIAATDVLDMPVLSELVMNIFTLIPKLLVAGVILVLGVLFAEALRGAVKTACDSLGIPSGKLISMMVFYFIVVNIFLVALSQAEIQTDFLGQNISLLIGGAILAFAIGYGLASKTTVSNFLASQYISDKVNIGDEVTVGSISGRVTELDKSSVCIDTGSSRVYVPLHQLSSTPIEVR